MKVLISTPIYDEQVLISYHTTIVRLLGAFARARPQVSFDHHHPASSIVGHARNASATLVLGDPSYSHLLFVDADMGFRPSLIEKMLDFDEPVVGCVAPMKGLNYVALADALRREGNVERARLAAQPYVPRRADFERDADGRVVRRGAFARMKRLGTGVLLIRRDVLETMAERFPELWADAPNGYWQHFNLPTARIFQAFAETKRDAGGLFEGEDYSFAARWVDDCGGEIWANVDEPITHVGRTRYLGHYQTVLDDRDGR